MCVLRILPIALEYIGLLISSPLPLPPPPPTPSSLSYDGHTFWDCETWMFPSLMMWHPSLARSLIKYRNDRVGEAKGKALSYNKGYEGAMFPWESGFTGVEVCPSWASTGQLEQHITGDISFAVQVLRNSY